jgi:hypothetical protein
VSSEGLIESFREIAERNPNRLTDLAEFNQIESPIASFVLAHERLGLTQIFRQVLLAQSRGEARLTKQPLQLLVLRREDALWHALNTLQLTRNTKAGYPNMGY